MKPPKTPKPKSYGQMVVGSENTKRRAGAETYRKDIVNTLKKSGVKNPKYETGIYASQPNAQGSRGYGVAGFIKTPTGQGVVGLDKTTTSEFAKWKRNEQRKAPVKRGR